MKGSNDTDNIYIYQTTTKNGKRISASVAYLEPIVGKRKNLQIASHSRVTKVVIENGKAIGVQYDRRPQGGHLEGNQTVYANKEVILCAGVVGTPHLLLLSGIGSKEELKKHNIPVAADLPGVGQNIQVSVSDDKS